MQRLLLMKDNSFDSMVMATGDMLKDNFNIQHKYQYLLSLDTKVTYIYIYM